MEISLVVVVEEDGCCCSEKKCGDVIVWADSLYGVLKNEMKVRGEMLYGLWKNDEKKNEEVMCFGFMRDNVCDEVVGLNFCLWFVWSEMRHE